MVHGWRSKKIRTVATDIICEKCGKEKEVTFDIYQGYMHVLWVPYFRNGKSIVSQCSNCGDIKNENNFSQIYLQKANIIKKQTATPLWVYIGLPFFIPIGYAIFQKYF